MKFSRTWLVIGLGLAAIAVPAAEMPADEGVPLSVDIRTSVDQRWQGFRKGGAIAHGKRYLLASVKEAAGAVPLIRPVNEGELIRLVRSELGKHGFQEITREQKPEIVLTVNYGRGFLRNPHLEDAMVDETNSENTTIVTITSLAQLMRQREANFEYPEDRGEKPHFFWRAIMAVDNPDGRDLNRALPAMLAAGAGYFDRETKEPEVTINSTLPTGTVKLGPLDVIEERTGK